MFSCSLVFVRLRIDNIISLEYISGKETNMVLYISKEFWGGYLVMVNTRINFVQKLKEKAGKKIRRFLLVSKPTILKLNGGLKNPVTVFPGMVLAVTEEQGDCYRANYLGPVIMHDCMTPGLVPDIRPEYGLEILIPKHLRRNLRIVEEQHVKSPDPRILARNMIPDAAIVMDIS